MITLENLGYSDALKGMKPRRDDSAEYMKGYHEGIKQGGKKTS